MSKSNIEYCNEKGLVLCGYHKKLKTMKKKYFALFKDTVQNVARLEYYDNEKKFRSGFNAKKTIKLKNCFNINRRLDTKYDFVIALSTREGGFGIILETEEEMNKWLNSLLSLQRRETNGWNLPHFDHIWQVHIQRKSLAEHKGLFGNYHVCLANKSVTFIKILSDKNILNDQRLSTVEVLLTTIRRCGDSQCIFYMEIGRQSILGPGEIWMETEDFTIAQHMHRMILSKMTSNDGPLEPMRKRSSSATESSKPLNERKTLTSCTTINNSLPNAPTFIRERCDSLPSRNRSSSECSNQNFKNATYRAHINPRLSVSPPMMCSESEESSISVDESDESFIFLPYRLSTRTSDEVIPEESAEEPSYSDTSIKNSHYIKSGDINDGNLNSEGRKYASTTSNLPKKSEHIEGLSESKESFMDMEPLCLRPVRAYSVGNRVQHCHIQSLKDKSTENCASRVRAFSVGSKAKLSKCDGMRTHPKLALNNNNNLHCMADTMSNKKSISAPLLVNKYYNCSAERMSDLMEIDFSKQSTRKYSSSKLPPKDIKKIDQRNVESLKNSIGSLVIGVSQTDNGYLEMKPIISIKSSKKNGLVSGTSNNANVNKNGSYEIISLQPDTCSILCAANMRSQGTSGDIIGNLSTISLEKHSNINVNLKKYDFDHCMNKEQMLDDASPCTEGSDGYIPNEGESTIQNAINNKVDVHSKNINENNCAVQNKSSKSATESNDVSLSTPGDIDSKTFCTTAHSLHYASLDLPMCSNRDYTSKINSPANETQSVMMKNSYAKINFDYHD